jgi:hypothetical protein
MHPMGHSEDFRPLIIERVIAARFNPLPLANEADDIPDHVFRLRKAYVLRFPELPLEEAGLELLVPQSIQLGRC